MPSCVRKTVQAFRITKAVVTRIIFGLHGVVCVWRVVVAKRQQWYWGLVSSLVLLIAETVFTLKKKKGGEWKWFCPSVFLYLASTLPAIWFLEMDLLKRRIEERNIDSHEVKTDSSKDNDPVRLGELSFQLPLEDWVKILEQILLLVLIVGRWLLPKGQITREQLSQLLLVYIGMAADIIELFEAFKEEEVKYNEQLTMIILSLWTASLLQFCFVMSAAKARKSRPSFTKVPSQSSLANARGCLSCRSEILSIMTTIILQDGSFLVLRMTLIFRYNVVSYTNIFFTAKNTLVNVLQLYRLVVLYAESIKLIKRQRSDPTFDERFLIKASILANQIAAREELRKKPDIRHVEVQTLSIDDVFSESTLSVEHNDANALIIENPMNTFEDEPFHFESLTHADIPKTKIKKCKRNMKTIGPEIMNITKVCINPALSNSDFDSGNISSDLSPKIVRGVSVDKGFYDVVNDDPNPPAKEECPSEKPKEFRRLVQNVMDDRKKLLETASVSQSTRSVLLDKCAYIPNEGETNCVPRSRSDESIEENGRSNKKENANSMEYLQVPTETTKRTLDSLELSQDISTVNGSFKKTRWRWRKAKKIKASKMSSDLNQNSDEDAHNDLEILGV